MAEKEWGGDPPPIIPVCEDTVEYALNWLGNDINRSHPDFQVVLDACRYFLDSYFQIADHRPKTLH